jgi:hypothetical protein
MAQAVCFSGRFIRVQDSVRELDDKLLGARERRSLGAGEVGQPVHKVEGHVSRAHAATLEELLELGEEHAWRRLCLHD